MVKKSYKEYLEFEYPISKIDVIIKDINDGAVSLIQIVEDIGPNLVNSEVNIRIKALKFLSEIVENLNDNYLQPKEIEVIFSYFLKCISDHYSMTPISIKVFKKLLKMYNTNSEIMINILKCIFNEVVVQTLIQEDRILVYQMFDWILIDKLDVIKQMEAEFIMGIIQACDSEKDPKNLLVIFDLVASIGKNLTLASQAEELFEIVACYFPIDFSPPPDASYETITRSELATCLEKSLLSTPEFAPFLLPFILEKFSSSIPSVKMESLKIIISSIDIYDVQILKEYISPIWAQIKNDIYVVKKEIEIKLLELLSIIIYKFSYNQNYKNESIKQLFEDIYEDCGKHIYKPDIGFYFEPSSKIILTSIKAHPASAIYFITNLFPTILNQFLENEINNQIIMSNFLLNILRADNNIEFKETVINFQQQLNNVTNVLLKSNNDKLRSTGFQIYISILVLKYPKDFITNKNIYNEDVESSILDLIFPYGDEIKKDITINSFKVKYKNCELEVLNDMCPIIRFICSEEDLIVRIKCLECFSWLLPNLELIIVRIVVPEIMINYLLTDSDKLKRFLLNLILTLKESNQVIGFVNGIIKHFFMFSIKNNRCLSTKQVSSTLEFIEYFCKLFQENEIQNTMKDYVFIWLQLFLDLLESIFDQDIASFSISLKIMTISKICLIYSSVYKRIKVGTEKMEYYSMALNIEKFVQNDYAFILGKKELYWPIICSIVCSLDIKIEIPCVQELLNISFNSSILFENDPYNISTTASQIVSAIINRLEDGEQLEIFLQTKEDYCFKIFAKAMSKNVLTDSDDFKEISQAINLWCWMAKALVMRNHKRQTTFTNQLVDMLIWPGGIGKLAADGFRIIMELHQYVLSIPGAVNQTMMFKQRLFSLTINRLVGSFQLSPDEMKINHIIALSNMMKCLEMPVIQMELNNIIPILIASLSIKNEEIIEEALNNFSVIIKVSPELLVNYFEDILPLFLSLINHPKMKIKLAAISCITSLSYMPTYLTLRSKNKVLKSLLQPLDDQKRFVRTAASQTRMQWFTLGE